MAFRSFRFSSFRRTWCLATLGTAHHQQKFSVRISQICPFSLCCSRLTVPATTADVSGAITNTVLSASKFPPANWLADALNSFHDWSALPWCATIAIVCTSVNLAFMILPFEIPRIRRDLLANEVDERLRRVVREIEVAKEAKDWQKMTQLNIYRKSLLDKYREPQKTEDFRSGRKTGTVIKYGRKKRSGLEMISRISTGVLLFTTNIVCLENMAKMCQIQGYVWFPTENLAESAHLGPTVCICALIPAAFGMAQVFILRPSKPVSFRTGVTCGHSLVILALGSGLLFPAPVTAVFWQWTVSNATRCILLLSMPSQPGRKLFRCHKWKEPDDLMNIIAKEERSRLKSKSKRTAKKKVKEQ